MPTGIKRTQRYQYYNRKNMCIENLKNRWADNRVSPYRFYVNFFLKYSNMTYDEFLQLINFDEVMSRELTLAIGNFWDVST